MLSYSLCFCYLFKYSLLKLIAQNLSPKLTVEVSYFSPYINAYGLTFNLHA